MIKRLLLVSFLILCLQDAFSAICLPGWSYNRSVTVTNSNGTAYTKFQAKLIVNTQALIAAGKMKANGDDIRFTDANCNNLHYWIDSNLNTTTTVIWVRINTIAANSSKTIYMYYGNYCATPAQNGDSTFVLFDDFNGSAINGAKWNTYQETPAFCTVTVAAGAATFTTTTNSDNVIRSVNNFAGPLRIEGKITANSGSFPSLALLNSGTFTGVAMYAGDAAFNDEFHLNTASASCVSYASSGNSSLIARANGVWGLTWPTTNVANSYFPGGTQSIAATNAITANQQAALGLLCTSLGTITYDWARLRLYAPVEMATVLNAEANQGITVNFTPTSICPGAILAVTFSKNGIYFNSGNTFRAQLSDASGNFGAPVLLGTFNDTVPDTFFAVIPRLTPPGNGYKVRVTTTNPAFGCFVAPASLTVYPKPTVSYNVLNDNQCYKWSRYNFSANASVTGGTISTYIWNWEDGSKIDTVTVNTISHKFKFFYPTYYPKLTVISDLGCTDTASKKVNILESPEVLTEFNDTIQCLKGNFFTIQTRSSPYYGVVTSNSWDLGDGSPVMNNIDSFSHVYTTGGIFNIQQANTHSNGCKDTGILSALVNVHPKARITTNDTDQCLTGNYFIFEAQSSITNGLPLLNSWNIGDGIIKDQDSIHHSYSPAGNRTVRLITTSDDGDDGCSDTVYQKILVNPMPKAVINNLDIERCLNFNKFRFKAKSTISTGTLTHNWDFGDMSTINNMDSVSHSYAANGTYTVKLRAISSKGCVDSTTTSATVRPSPIPSFTINKDTQCFKFHNFKAYSTSTISSGTFSKSWVISDGSSFTDVDSMSRKFANDGKYQIQLIVKSTTYNCADTAFDSVVVLPMPVSSFTVDDADQCFEGNSYTFTDNSFFTNGTITGNKWLLGDGTTAANVSPVQHNYLAENDYVPALLVYGNNGCFDTSFMNVKVYPHPASDFLINDTGQCVNNNNFVFNNNTFISEGSFTNRWLFGDGSAFVDGLNVSKKYIKDSTYTVRVVSFSDQGCTDTAWHTVTVFPKAKTNFTIDKQQQCKLDNSFNFASTTTLKYGTFTLGWNFGDGNLAGNQPNVQHSYTVVQTFNVRLVSFTNEGCLDTIFKPVTIMPMPVANFTFVYDKKCLVGNDFTFGATTTVNPVKSMTHKWYFGDNDSLINSTTANHTFKTHGTFAVTLISFTNNGLCADTATKNMTVFPMPVTSFTIDDDQQCFLNNSFNFASTSTIATGTIDFTNWTFGDNTSSSLASPAKSYAKSDSFRVSLITISDNGCMDSTFKRVYVWQMPLADFTVTPKSSCLVGNRFKIANKSKFTNAFTKYRFDYGNGDSSLLQNPPDTSYALPGDYTILLTVTTDKGCWDTATAEVSINPNPILDFDVAPVCLKDSSFFINKSTIPGGGSIASWKWLFGNGKSSTLESPAHKYKTVDSFDITLTATTDKGCVASLVKKGAAIVNPNPQAKFIYQKLRSWENEVDIQYIDSSRGAISWNWNFSSMGTSTEQNPKLFYVDTLTQLTTLIVTNVYGCKDTVSQILFIAPDVIFYMPNAFTPNDDNINETFKPRGLAYALNYKFIVFNRWGEILFKTDNPQLGWDGKFEGEVVEQGLYFYRLEFVGADILRHEEKGNVMILR